MRLALWIGLAALALAAPAQAVVVQYSGTLTSGFGDGGSPTDPGGTDFANNAFPACNPLGGVTIMVGTKTGFVATDGSAMFVGTANVVTGMAPQAVQFQPAGGGLGLVTNCTTTIPNVQPQLTMRTQTTVLTWPANSGTFQAGGGFAPFTFGVSPPKPSFTNQRVKAYTIMGPDNNGNFGGAIRVNGLVNAKLVARVAPTPQNPYRLKGSFPARLNVGAQGGAATPTFIFSTTAMFNLARKTVYSAVPTIVPNYLTGTILQAFFPWTTGRIVASDNTGQFFTLRSRVGYDKRNAAGTTGTLQLVTPALTLISGIGAPLPFTPTSVLKLVFTPEPAATALLGAGVLALLGLRAVQRRRR